jgi:hypothetical protein
VSASAQQKATITGVADIPFTSVPNFLKLPPGESLGDRLPQREHAVRRRDREFPGAEGDDEVRVRTARIFDRLKDNSHIVLIDLPQP